MSDSALLLRFAHRICLTLLATFTVAALPTLPVGAADIWSGPSINFTNAVGSDPTLPANQDRLTLNVWLTRGPTHGLFNAVVETSYGSLSPVGTEWAYGALPNFASLNYQPWVDWNGKNPPSMVGQDAVLHLVPDDVYLAIHFTSWNVGAGGFSYTRSSPPVPEPSAGLLLLLGVTAVVGAQFYHRRLRASARAE